MACEHGIPLVNFDLNLESFVAHLQVHVPGHPLVAHWLAVCRNKASPPPIFRNAVAELGRILIYEAAAEWLPTVNGQVETPFGVADCTFVDPNKPVKVSLYYLSFDFLSFS